MTEPRSPGTVVAAEPAATLMVLRETPAGAEVLLLRRDARLRFMPNAWAFPGGRLDPADLTPAATAALGGGDADALRAAVAGCRVLPVAEPVAGGLVLAAVRELEEETGLNLRAPGAAPEAPPDWSALAYWARWITPSTFSRRFDTHFFAAVLGVDQAVRLGEGEVAEARWMSPAQALNAIEEGTLDSAAPTLLALRDLVRALTRHRSARELVAGERSRVVVPMLPKILRGAGGGELVLPWDAHYESSPGEGIVVAGDLPSFWRDWPSRMAPSGRRR